MAGKIDVWIDKYVENSEYQGEVAKQELLDILYAAISEM